MSTAAAWRWCLAAGLLAFACSWGFGRIPGLHPCGDTGGLGAILAFEFAQTPADVTRLFGAEPCRSALVAAQRTGLWLDALGFIPSYTAFLCFAAWAAGRRRAWPVMAALLVAGLCDEIEGGLLWAILRDLPGTPPLLGALFWAVRTKFMLLGMGTFAVAVLLLWRRPRLTDGSVLRLVGGLGIGYGAVAALQGFFAGPLPAMMTAFAGAWFTLLLVALVGAVSPSRPARGARLPSPASPSA